MSMNPVVIKLMLYVAIVFGSGMEYQAHPEWNFIVVTIVCLVIALTGNYLIDKLIKK